MLQPIRFRPWISPVIEPELVRGDLCNHVAPDAALTVDRTPGRIGLQHGRGPIFQAGVVCSPCIRLGLTSFASGIGCAINRIGSHQGIPSHNHPGHAGHGHGHSDQRDRVGHGQSRNTGQHDRHQDAPDDHAGTSPANSAATARSDQPQ